MKVLVFLHIFLVILVISCQDIIDINIPKGDSVIVVEGWLTNKREVQYIKLYQSKGISQQGDYEPVTKAQMILTDDSGRREELTETDKGIYAISKLRAIVGRTYTLNIQTSEGSYRAVTEVPRLSLSPDSLTFKYENKSFEYERSGYYPMLNAVELEGPGDYVQVRLYKNGTYLSNSDDINLFSDKYADGYYIGNMVLNISRPCEKGDLLKAEVWSLSEPAYLFWHDIQEQLHNAQVFAVPLTNVRTNIKKIERGSKNITGFFGASIVKSVDGR